MDLTRCTGREMLAVRMFPLLFRIEMVARPVWQCLDVALA